MTTEALLREKEIDYDLKNLKQIRQTLNSPYKNCRLKCIGYGGKTEMANHTLAVDDELKGIIENYLSQKINALEKEFGEL